MPWTPEAVELSKELAKSLGQRTWLEPTPELDPEEGDLLVLSRTRPGKGYVMVLTLEGIAVHQGEGCENEVFSGPLGCWHSTEGSEIDMTQAVTTYQSQIPQRAEFSEEEIKVIKNTICRGSTDAELGLFLATCRSTGLNPFMKQIWAIKRNVNVGTKANPKWESQMQIQVGIDGYRVVRDRLVDQNGLSLFEGMDGPQWSADGQEWLDYPFDAKPKFARVGIWRRGMTRPFVAVARWEAYNQDNAMWQTMGAEQLAKCAEALALRRAFPADMSGLPSGAVAELDPPTDDLPEPIAALIDAPIEGEVVDAALVTAETRAAVEKAYAAVRDARGAEFLPMVRQRLCEQWGHAFLHSSNRVGALTEAQALDVLQFLDGETPKFAEPAEPSEEAPALPL